MSELIGARRRTRPEVADRLEPVSGFVAFQVSLTGTAAFSGLIKVTHKDTHTKGKSRLKTHTHTRNYHVLY